MEDESGSGAELTALVLKAAAVIVLVGGLIGATVVGAELSNTALSRAADVWTSVGIAVGSIISAAMFAFFGYSLELFVQIRDAVEATADITIAPDDDEAAA